MTYYIVKLLVAAAVIVAVSETAKRSGYLGGVIASLPLVSIMAITWLYIDTHEATQVTALAKITRWFVLPSMPFFIVLPALLQTGRSFAISMTVALLSAAMCCAGMAAILHNLVVRL